MTLTGMKKHVQVLEDAGLVVSEKVGRARQCRLGDERLEEAMTWIAYYRKLWGVASTASSSTSPSKGLDE